MVVGSTGTLEFQFRGVDMGMSTLFREDLCGCKVIAANLGRQVLGLLIPRASPVQQHHAQG